MESWCLFRHSRKTDFSDKLLEKSGLGKLYPRPHLPSFIENFRENFLIKKNPSNKSFLFQEIFSSRPVVIKNYDC